MSNLQATSILNDYCQDWHGISVTEVTDYELVSLSVAQGHADAFKVNYKKFLKSALPQPQQNLPLEGGFSLWLEPETYLVMLDGNDVNYDKKLAEKFGDSGYAVLLSDGWTCLKIAGPKTKDIFDRFIPLNMRDAPADFAARTSAHHMSVIVACLVDGSYLLLTPRTSSQAFLEALTHTIEHVLN